MTKKTSNRNTAMMNQSDPLEVLEGFIDPRRVATKRDRRRNINVWEEAYPSSSRSSSTTDTRNDNEKDGGKRVKFVNVEIREYDVTLVDNPACSFGPAVGLDWTFSQRDCETLAAYEDRRSRQYRRTTPQELGLSYNQRHEILRNAGFTKKEINKAERGINKARRQRQSTRFWLPLTRLQEGAASRGKLHKPTDHHHHHKAIQ